LPIEIFVGAIGISQMNEKAAVLDALCLEHISTRRFQGPLTLVHREEGRVPKVENNAATCSGGL